MSNLVSKSILAAELIKILTLSKILYISLYSVIIFALVYKTKSSSIFNVFELTTSPLISIILESINE